MDERYYPVYDVLGRYSTREEGLMALAEYNWNPYSISDREMTFSQMDKYALQNDIIEKGYSSFAAITVSEDDTPGVPFTSDELQLLWNNKDVPWVDSILIYIYSGWRVSELILMPTEAINLKDGTFKGGLKMAAGKNRIVPIHSKIRGFVEHRLKVNHGILFSLNDKPIYTA